MPVNMPACNGRTERPRGVLLRFDIEEALLIVENRWEPLGASGIPPFKIVESNQRILETYSGTVSDCQFGWGSRLLKSNADVQRLAWSGRKSDCKYKGKS